MRQHTLRRWAKGGRGLETEHEGKMARNNLRRYGTRGVKKGIDSGKRKESEEGRRELKATKEEDCPHNMWLH